MTLIINEGLSIMYFVYYKLICNFIIIARRSESVLRSNVTVAIMDPQELVPLECKYLINQQLIIAISIACDGNNNNTGFS